MRYGMALSWAKGPSTRAGRILLCDASQVLSTFDTLMEYAKDHGIKDPVVKFQGHTYESRAEFLDMIFTINAYSTAHNGTKIFM